MQRTRPAGARTTLRALLLSCHPAPTVAVTVVSAALATGVGLTSGRVVLFTAAVLTGQLSIGWSNDRIDAARDAANARGDKPTATGGVTAGIVGAAAAIALIATIVLSVAVGGRAAIALLALVTAGWAYNLGLKATVWSAATYLVGFGALGAAPYLARPGGPWPPWWAPAAGALLGSAAHFANVLPDLRADAATGVRGLPHRLGARGSTIAMGLLLAAASVVLAVGPERPTPLAVAAAMVGLAVSGAVAVLAARRPDSPAAFRLIMALAVLDVALVVTLAG